MDKKTELGFKAFRAGVNEEMPGITVKQTDKHYVVKVPKTETSQSGVNEGNPIALGLYNIVVIDGKMMVMREEETL